MPISGELNLSPFDVLNSYSPSYTQDVPAGLGNIGSTPDGRKFKLGFNNTASTTLAANKLTQGPAVTANLQAVTCSSQSIGDTQITITFSSSSFAANAFAGGFIGIISGTGSVQTLQIKSHPVVSSGTTCVLTLADPIYIATSGSPVANVWANPYSAVIISPTTITGTITGINIVAIAAQYYGWFQVEGLCLALNDAGSSAGVQLMPSTNTAGALMQLAASGASTGQSVAISDQAIATTAYGFVTLTGIL